MTGIVGAGAFGLALAVALGAEGRPVRLWARDSAQRRMMRDGRRSPRLPGAELPGTVAIVDTPAELTGGGPVLLALPMQALRGFLDGPGRVLLGEDLVACSKGLDLTTLQGPAEVIASAGARGAVAVLTGPGFAADIARGLPTALTLASRSHRLAAIQLALSTASLRLYRTDDVAGAQLGGAYKNVVAIGAGVVAGAALGESARAALIARGHAEMGRLGAALGARAETLAGLSGLGDLILTCTSLQSRNYSHGVALASGGGVSAVTVEGIATARASVRLAAQRGIELPIATMVARLMDGEIDVDETVRALMSRPLKQE